MTHSAPKPRPNIRATPKPPPARPHFLPEGLDYDRLSESVKLSLNEIVVPLYESYVVKVRDPLARAIGNGLVFVVTLEIVEQADLGAKLFAAGSAAWRESEERLTRIDTYLKLVASKAEATKLLLRLHEHRARVRILREKFGPLSADPNDPLAGDSAVPELVLPKVHHDE